MQRPCSCDKTCNTLVTGVCLTLGLAFAFVAAKADDYRRNVAQDTGQILSSVEHHLPTAAALGMTTDRLKAISAVSEFAFGGGAIVLLAAGIAGAAGKFKAPEL